MRVLYYMEKELANFDATHPGPGNSRLEKGECLFPKERHAAPCAPQQFIYLFSPSMGLMPPSGSHWPLQPPAGLMPPRGVSIGQCTVSPCASPSHNSPQGGHGNGSSAP